MSESKGKHPFLNAETQKIVWLSDKSAKDKGFQNKYNLRPLSAAEVKDFENGASIERPKGKASKKEQAELDKKKRELSEEEARLQEERKDFEQERKAFLAMKAQTEAEKANTETATK